MKESTKEFLDNFSFKNFGKNPGGIRREYSEQISKKKKKFRGILEKNCLMFFWISPEEFLEDSLREFLKQYPEGFSDKKNPEDVP